MFGVLPAGDIHQAVVDHGSGDDVVLRAGAKDPLRFFGIDVKLPQQFRTPLAITGRIEGVHPAVATGEDCLRLAAQHPVGGARPLAVQDVAAGRFVGPQHFAGVFIQRDEARGVGRGKVDVRLVEAVGGVYQQDVSHRGDATTTHVVLRNAQLAHHVKDPYDIGFILHVVVDDNRLFAFLFRVGRVG